MSDAIWDLINKQMRDLPPALTAWELEKKRHAITRIHASERLMLNKQLPDLIDANR